MWLEDALILFCLAVKKKIKDDIKAWAIQVEERKDCIVKLSSLVRVNTNGLIF
jgi:hypothetical protein